VWFVALRCSFFEIALGLAAVLCLFCVLHALRA
jgi:hypothetical protein